MILSILQQQRLWKRITEGKMTWQPIETAPKDGTSFIVWDSIYGFMPFIYWSNGNLISDNIRWSGRATHWMPLPKPPETE